MSQPVEGVSKAGNASKQPRGGDCLECVAHCDAGRDNQRLVRGGVGNEGSKENPWPNLGPEQEERRQGKAGRGPHERHLFGGVRHREAEFRRRDVDSRHGQHEPP